MRFVQCLSHPPLRAPLAAPRAGGGEGGGAPGAKRRAGRVARHALHGLCSDAAARRPRRFVTRHSVAAARARAGLGVGARARLGRALARARVGRLESADLSREPGGGARSLSPRSATRPAPPTRTPTARTRPAPPRARGRRSAGALFGGRLCCAIVRAHMSSESVRQCSSILVCSDIGMQVVVLTARPLRAPSRLDVAQGGFGRVRRTVGRSGISTFGRPCIARSPAGRAMQGRPEVESGQGKARGSAAGSSLETCRRGDPI